MDGRSRSRTDDLKSDDEFLTASECTIHHSRSSSYNSANEIIDSYSQWWDYGKEDDCDNNVSKEKMVLAVGLPQLPQPDDVLKPSPEIPPNSKIVHEVTETTHIKVKHVHNMDVASYVLTSETVKDERDDDTRSIAYDKMPIIINKESYENKLSSFSEKQLKRLENDPQQQQLETSDELKDDGGRVINEKQEHHRYRGMGTVELDSLDDFDVDERDKLRRIKEVSERFDDEAIKCYNYVTKYAIKSYF